MPNNQYLANREGYYGEFGGAYIPEMLYPNIHELRENYQTVLKNRTFKAEFNALLKEYVGRPTPLYFARNLSEHYHAQIYLKREDLNHTGSHKINNAIGQILLASKLGKRRIIAETGAGQHGVAVATVCALKKMSCTIFMGETDVNRQSSNVTKIRMLGAELRIVKSGNKTLKDATNEALRDWIRNPVDTHYLIGSVVGPHPFPDLVTALQSIISEEIMDQLVEQRGNPLPDYVLACIGGGSNAAGAFYHFLESEKVKLVAAEGAGKGLNTNLHAATISMGTTGIIHSSKTLLLQTNDGQIIEPYSISAGLDYPGIGPLHANLHKQKRAVYLGITDKEALRAASLLARTEGIIPALESAHALALLNKISLTPNDTVVVNLSGRGDKDVEIFNSNNL